MRRLSYLGGNLLEATLGHSRDDRSMIEAVGGSVDADEFYVAQTDDGWRLPIYRFLPRSLDGIGKTALSLTAEISPLVPVVLVHGLGANRFTFVDNGQTNFAGWLADRGHDVFVVELRGAGNSQALTPNSFDASRWTYDFDTYLEFDVPPILTRISEITGSTEVDWVGHSMGGMLLYALAGTIGGCVSGVKVRRGVAVASPAVIQSLPFRMKVMLSIAGLLPLQQLPNRRWLQFASTLNPFLIFPEDASLGMAQNYHPDFVQEFVRKVGSDLSSAILTQVGAWIGRDGIYSRDGKINYTAELRQSAIPMQLIAARNDRVAPPHSVAAAMSSQHIDSDFILVSKDNGFANDYGHTDIVVGKNAPEDVYPIIARWLAKKGS